MRFKLIPLFIILFAFQGCHLLDKDEMLPEILGKWHTSSAPRYHNFTIEITEKLIIFHNGPDIRDVHSISRIASVQEDGKALHKLYFKNSKGEKSHLFLYLLKENDEPVLQFKNQENIKWTRVPER